VLLIGGGAWFARSGSSRNDLPRSVQQAAAFSLYSPAWLPDGYYIDYQSASATSQVATFSINNASGKALVVTEQPQPDDDQMTAFYDQQLIDTKTISTDIGQVTTGQFETSPFTGITTGRTWILIRAVTTVDQSTSERIARSFEAIN
jgi:hypothetical protein